MQEDGQSDGDEIDDEDEDENIDEGGEEEEEGEDDGEEGEEDDEEGDYDRNRGVNVLIFRFSITVTYDLCSFKDNTVPGNVRIFLNIRIQKFSDHYLL